MSAKGQAIETSGPIIRDDRERTFPTCSLVKTRQHDDRIFQALRFVNCQNLNRIRCFLGQRTLGFVWLFLYPRDHQLNKSAQGQPWPIRQICGGVFEFQKIGHCLFPVDRRGSQLKDW
jgi:hypothetical protein